MRKVAARWATAMLLGAGVLAGTVQLPTPACASVLKKLSLAELAGRADRVLVGTVEEVKPRMIGGNYIVTDVRIRCTREVLGVPEGSVFTVRHLGGEVGELGQKVFGEASYRVGEEVLLLAEERAGSFYAVGMAQGALHIERDAQSGERRVRVDLSGAELHGAVPNEPTANGANVESVLGQLQSLLGDKQAALRSRAVAPAKAAPQSPAGKGGN